MEISRDWKDGKTKDITFIVTKDCQLACKYCYLVGKKEGERMNWDVAREAIDYILSHERDVFFKKEGVVFNFIGGEPFLEIELIDKMCDYLKQQMYLRDHHWFNAYRFSITTNGINYNSPAVQRFIEKNRRHLSLTITIDGTKRKHDANRIWRHTGEGSYDHVVSQIPLWLKQFPDAATKVTISSPDLPYVCESVMHLFKLGIHRVMMNCVFENVWCEGDDRILESQLMELSDRILDEGYGEDYECTIFDREIGHPLDPGTENYNWCGAGRMLAIDAKGNLYPCTRFAKYSLRSKPPRSIGNLKDGIDKNLLRPYLALSRTIQSEKRCIECEMASGCAWCQGENYDSSSTGTIFHRSTAICKMHKARVRANNYFWRKHDKLFGICKKPKNRAFNLSNYSIDKRNDNLKEIYVFLSEDSPSICGYASGTERRLIDFDRLNETIHMACEGRLELSVVYPSWPLPEEYATLLGATQHRKIRSGYSEEKSDVAVVDGLLENRIHFPASNIIAVRTTVEEFCRSFDKLNLLIGTGKRVEVSFIDEELLVGEMVDVYRETLRDLARSAVEYMRSGINVDFNLLTDRLRLSEMNNCEAGWKWVAIMPDGKFYPCPAFYYARATGENEPGETTLSIKNGHLYNLDHAPECRGCSHFHCRRCVYQNWKSTKEINIPSFEYCSRRKIEEEASKYLFDLWKREE